METINEVKLSGYIIKTYPLKHTPYGLPVESFILEHVSHEPITPPTKCKVYCISINQPQHTLSDLINHFVIITGTLGQNVKAQLVLNVKQIFDKGLI